MRSPRRVAALLLFAAACTVGDASNSGLGAGPDAGVDEGGDPGACEGPLGPPRADMSGLEVCCQAEGGEGHCLSEVPAEVQPFLGACAAGGFCVPDQFLRSGGTEPPADCTAFGGPGVCLSRCVPQVAENAGLLPPDVCTGDQLCVPCVSPLDGMPTGACDLKDF